LLWLRTIPDVVAHGLKERRATRRVGRASLFGTVIQDVRYALRLFARQPGFTMAAVATLAIGIGGTAAAFSVIHAAVLRPVRSGATEIVASFDCAGRPATRYNPRSTAIGSMRAARRAGM
jgi:hypothetical protein